MTRESALRCRFRAYGSALEVPVFEQEHLVRIVQEAVSNAVRHSGATAVDVDVYHAEHSVRVRVSDNGRGFELDKLRHAEGHWGIMFMRERAQQIGAEITIMSAPSEGTVVECSVPYANVE
ncbi:MAG: sensor histidine kinase [Thermoanaerobaculia bacterium]